MEEIKAENKNSNTALRQHQSVMYEMLCELDDICRRSGIKYTLFAGTLLGAVRHKGFIPWDDDLDVLMLRPEYDKFLEAAEKELSKEYYLQKEFSAHWPCNSSKIRKNGTACIEKTMPKDRLQHQGVYIDIFPCDNLSDSRFKRKLQFAASKVVIAKCLDRRGYLTNSIAKKLFMLICRLLPMKPFLTLTQNRREGSSKWVHSFLGGSHAYKKSVYPREWISDTEPMRFEKREFPVSKHYDGLLTTLYGDYMKIPPESERACKVHAMKVDLENSYEKYLDWQAEQKVEVFTRSIR